MASILDALLGGQKSEQDYLAENPFYMSGVNIARTPAPAPRTSSEAFLMPVLQGLASGGLAGYGREQAANAGYSDIKSALGASPAFADAYASDTRPEGWTFQQGAKDRVLQALQTQQDQAMEQEQIKAALAAQVDKQKSDNAIRENFAKIGLVGTPDTEVGKIAGFGDANAETKAIEVLASENAKNQAAQAVGMTIPELANVPIPLRGDAVKELAIKKQKEASFKFIDEKFNEAKKLTGFGAGLTGVSSLATKGLGTIPTAKGNALQGIADAVIFQLDNTMGREINSDVRKRLTGLAPQFYDSDKELDRKAARIKEIVTSLTKATPVLDATGGATTSSPSIPEGAVDTGRKTPGTNLPIYIVNGVEGVFE